MIARLAAVLVAVCLLPGHTDAQTGASRTLDPDRPLRDFGLDVWTQRDGLPQNMAAAFAQTTDGYLWIGTEEGLVRFDGARFTVFRPATTPAFSTGWVTALLADDDGTLWIGTGGGGLVRMRRGAFTAYTIDDGLPSNHVQTLYRDGDGALWIGTNGGGLGRFVDGAFDVLDTGSGLASDLVFDIGGDTAGGVWVATAEGLNRIRDGRIETFDTADGLPGQRIRAVVGAPDGAVWVGTTDGGISRFVDGRFTTYSTADGLSSDYVTSLHVDPAGALWVGTNGGGLNRVHRDGIDVLTSESGLPSNLVLTVGGDREGSVWMGLTGAGVARLRDGSFSSIGRPEGLSVDIALALLEDRRGDVWIGTAGGGLNRLSGGEITTYTTAQGLAHNVVLALEESRDGDLWVGLAAGGISRIRDGRVRSFGPDDGLVSTQVVDILEADDGALWLGTLGAGVQRWRPGGGASRVVTRADGLPDDYVTALLEADDGSIWVGTRNGLGRIHEAGVSAHALAADGSPSNNVTGLYHGSDGSIWVSTNSGLGRIRDGRITLYGRDVGPFEREIHGVVEDRHGHLWLSSNHGIARVRRSDLDAVDDGYIERVRSHRFDTADGLRSAEANGGVNPAGLLRSDGSVWFPTMRGVAIVDPARVRVGRPVPPPLLEHVVAGDSVHAGVDTLRLAPDARSLEFHFTAPTFEAPQEVRFRYMLDGFDADWIDAGDRRVAYYTNLPPGRYRFRVGTRRGDGEWAEAEAAVHVSLAPHFYETPAFLLLLGLAVTGAGIAGYRLRIRRLTQRQTELVCVVAERERTERALRLSQERLRLALEAGRMGTWEWDVTTGGVVLSATAAELLGHQPHTLEEARQVLNTVARPEDIARLTDIGRRVADGRRDFDHHLPITTPGGALRYIEVRGRAYLGPDGRPIRFAGVAADVTDVITAQEELRRREEELRQAQKMEAVGRLAGGVAHDFNNLLTAISGRTEFLLEALPDGDPRREDVEEVRDAADRATNLTQQLLTFSRKQVVSPRTLDLNGVVAGLERMLRRLIREDVRLDTRLDPRLAAVRADAGGMEQILVNLVLNAQDAMPGGGRVLIRTRNGSPGDGGGTRPGRDGGAATAPDEERGAAPTHVVLSVIDTGHGMTADIREHAFEPFFTTKPVGKGTGLGLATVYAIVQQSGGEIHVQSEPGRGTRFDIYLPRVAGAEERSAARRGTGGALGGAETILLVEDEPAVRSLARKILERRGYNVLEAADGHQALGICRQHQDPIDLLVSDVVMPELGGRELAEEILRLRPDTRVLLMSGYNEDEVLRRGVHDSGMAFIQKPFQPADFARRVREVLDSDAGVPA